jgi:DNA-binding transcriptional ArsR family regulator
MSIVMIDLGNMRFEGLEARAGEVSAVLGAMANSRRLLVLCNLLEGEKSVGQLAERVSISPAALSQHLGKMRGLGLVATRRDGQTIHYRLASDAVRKILRTLDQAYCGRN